MKFYSLVLLAFLGLALCPVQAAGLPGDTSLSFGFDWMPWANVQDDVNRLNRMVGHVRFEFSRYRSSRALQQEYWHVRHEVDALNARHKQGNYDRGKMRADIERLHVRLHDIELKLNAK